MQFFFAYFQNYFSQHKFNQNTQVFCSNEYVTFR